MDEKIKRKLYDEVKDPWAFVIRASKYYKSEFRKTSKIGIPPKIDDILEAVILNKDIEETDTKKKSEKEK